MIFGIIPSCCNLLIHPQRVAICAFNMSDAIRCLSIESSNSSTLYEVLKSCANLPSYDSLPIADYNDACPHPGLYENYKMISTNSSYSTSGNISCSSFASDDSFGDSILEEDGRISLAYENLRTIPRRIAEKFAMQTKFLDLSYNNFQNLSFLTFFEDLHTLILDRNTRLDVNTLPYLPNLKILWINNCDITNITDWIHRIRTHCPVLEHLSVMGNPGIKNLSDCCTLTTDSILDPSAQYIGGSGDYRDYILQVLPNLEYLDGMARTTPTYLTTAHLGNGNGKLSGCDGSPDTTNNSASDCRQRDRQKNSPTLSFKDLFRLKRRKKTHSNNSSTN